MIAGFALCLLCVVGGVACVLCGHDSAGATIATVAVVGLATTFVYGTKVRTDKRARK